MQDLYIQELKLNKKESEAFGLLAKDIRERFNEVNLIPLRAVQESVRKLAESFVPPVALIETFKKTVEQQRKIAQSMAFVPSQNVISNYSKSEIARPIKPRFEYLLEDQNRLLEELIEKQETKTPTKSYEYYPETTTFQIYWPFVGAINFSTKGGEDNITTLFEICYEALEERGKVQNGYKTVFVPAEEIIQKAVEKGKEDADSNWLKRTRYNLANKIPEKLKRVVEVSWYDKNKKGYSLSIRINEDLVN